MRDIQVSIANYQRASAGFGVDAETLATPVRTLVVFVEVLNEVLCKDFSGKAAYLSLFASPADPRVELIEAFKYVRNVGQHLIHPVAPDPTAVVGGMGLGFRTVATWQSVPPSVHARLRPSTQKLKVHFDTHLVGKDVTETVLDAARFFWEVCPDLVHRDSNFEWTGFPLRHQAGVSTRLHPEEPVDRAAALTWMATRRPGGDLRVVSGSLYDAGDPIVFGLTLRQGCAFSPFFETAEQVEADIAMGYPYFEAEFEPNMSIRVLHDVTGPFPPVWCSNDLPSTWIGSPIAKPRTSSEWSSHDTIDFWRTQWVGERDPHGFLTRRERRLSAWFPLN